MNDLAGAFEAVIGLEVHAQLLTKTKAFCGCAAAFGASPNTHVCPTCLGLPGALPVLNAEAVKLAVRTALALGATIRPRSLFARKNYFYPDLPKGYQISQYDEPFSDGGVLEFVTDGGETKRARITRVHMEEDAGKNLHDRGSESIVDLNRSGVPLVEIVGEPDLRSGADAAAYLRALHARLVFLGTNDGNLEKGSFRCDANVSIRPRGSEILGTRVELKNINSFRFVQKAIEHEIARQAAVLASGGRIVQETRGWNEEAGTTFAMRSKESANDYRYFPEPDLPPLLLSEAFVDEVRRTSPELPEAKRARYVADLGLTPYAAEVLSGHPAIARFFEAAAEGSGEPVKVANFVQGEVLRDAHVHGVEAEFPITPEQARGLVELVTAGTISGKQAKELYGRVRGTGADPAAVAKEAGMLQVSDAGAIEAIVAKVLAANPKQAESLRSGKIGLLGYFVGQVMKETQGSANPGLVNAALKKALGLP